MYLKSQISPLAPPQTDDSIIIPQTHQHLRDLMLADAARIPGGKVKVKTNPAPIQRKKQNDNRKRILAFLRKRKVWTPTAIIVQAVNLAESTVRAHTNKLADEGVIQRKVVGVGYHFKYLDPQPLALD